MRSFRRKGRTGVLLSPRTYVQEYVRWLARQNSTNGRFADGELARDRCMGKMASPQVAHRGGMPCGGGRTSEALPVVTGALESAADAFAKEIALKLREHGEHAGERPTAGRRHVECLGH
jgi:hypothetical protein